MGALIAKRTMGEAERLELGVRELASSPIGPLVLYATERGLVSIDFGGAEDSFPVMARWGEKQGCAVQFSEGFCAGLLDEAELQLQRYFAGELRRFDLPLDLRGTPFQIQVWESLQRIPYGEARSYRDVAADIGKPLAVRAVGGANNRNPIPVIVPCHRVIGANGSMVGYGGGLPIKESLLSLEGWRGHQ